MKHLIKKYKVMKHLPDLIITPPDVLAEIIQEEEETANNEHDADYFIDAQKEGMI